jgi:hypothetical protein
MDTRYIYISISSLSGDEVAEVVGHLVISVRHCHRLTFAQPRRARIAVSSAFTEIYRLLSYYFVTGFPRTRAAIAGAIKEGAF